MRGEVGRDGDERGGFMYIYDDISKMKMRIKLISLPPGTTLSDL